MNKTIPRLPAGSEVDSSSRTAPLGLIAFIVYIQRQMEWFKRLLAILREDEILWCMQPNGTLAFPPVYGKGKHIVIPDEDLPKVKGSFLFHLHWGESDLTPLDVMKLMTLDARGVCAIGPSFRYYCWNTGPFNAKRFLYHFLVVLWSLEEGGLQERMEETWKQMLILYPTLRHHVSKRKSSESRFHWSFESEFSKFSLLM